MTGLGLDDFLIHNQGGGGRRKFFGKWKDDGVAIIWISTRANIAYPSWNHPFYKLDVVENKKTGEEEEILRFMRFVSPDPEIVHQQQHFRNKEDSLQTPPISDPFLLLREWLRDEIKAERIDLDTVVFEWEDPKKRETIEWTAGEISRMQERGQSNWNHSLDSKLEYLFVIVDNDNPDEGPQITRETKLIGDKMKEEISAQIESEGHEDGNPLVNPYAFKWKFNKNESSPMKMYTANRYNRAKLTDEIREAITDPEFPDPTPDTKPRPGDKAKIRAAFEEAAQIDLPWGLLFDDTPWDDEDPTSFDSGENAKGKGDDKPKGKAKGSSSGKPKGKSKGDDKPKGKASSSSSDDDKPKSRRRKKKKPEPEPEPEEDLIKCDDCPQMLKPTDTVCPGCGAEYDVDGDDEEGEEEPPKAKAKSKGQGKAKSSSSGKSKGKGKGKSKPDPEPEPEDDEDEDEEEGDDGDDDGDEEDEECWSCGGEIGDDNKCKNCGLDAGDELPL